MGMNSSPTSSSTEYSGWGMNTVDSKENTQLQSLWRFFFLGQSFPISNLKISLLVAVLEEECQRNGVGREHLHEARHSVSLQSSLFSQKIPLHGSSRSPSSLLLQQDIFPGVTQEVEMPPWQTPGSDAPKHSRYAGLILRSCDVCLFYYLFYYSSYPKGFFLGGSWLKV